MILKARHVTVAGHISPDGDVIGSMLGLGFALASMGKEYVLVLPDNVPASLKFVPGVEQIVEKPKKLAATDLIVALDTSDPMRLGSVYHDNLDLFQSVPVVNIDHHITNNFVATSVILDSSAAATAEQIVDLLHEMSVPIDPTTALCLLVGIVSDTQCFRTANTTSRTLEIAVSLIERGAPLSWIVDCLYKALPVSKLSLWGNALSDIRLSGGIVWTCITQEALHRCNASGEETEGLVDVLAGVKEAEVAALFKEVPGGSVKVSLRSSGKADVARLASDFKGGGHPRAAGFSLECSLDEAQELVIRSVNRLLAES